MSAPTENDRRLVAAWRSVIDRQGNEVIKISRDTLRPLIELAERLTAAAE